LRKESEKKLVQISSFIDKIANVNGGAMDRREELVRLEAMLANLKFEVNPSVISATKTHIGRIEQRTRELVVFTGLFDKNEKNRCISIANDISKALAVAKAKNNLNNIEHHLSVIEYKRDTSSLVNSRRAINEVKALFRDHDRLIFQEENEKDLKYRLEELKERMRLAEIEVELIAFERSVAGFDHTALDSEFKDAWARVKELKYIINASRGSEVIKAGKGAKFENQLKKLENRLANIRKIGKHLKAVHKAKAEIPRAAPIVTRMQKWGLKIEKTSKKSAMMQSMMLKDGRRFMQIKEKKKEVKDEAEKFAKNISRRLSEKLSDSKLFMNQKEREKIANEVGEYFGKNSKNLTAPDIIKDISSRIEDLKKEVDENESNKECRLLLGNVIKLLTFKEKQRKYIKKSLDAKEKIEQVIRECIPDLGRFLLIEACDRLNRDLLRQITAYESVEEASKRKRKCQTVLRNAKRMIEKHRGRLRAKSSEGLNEHYLSKIIDISNRNISDSYKDLNISECDSIIKAIKSSAQDYEITKGQRRERFGKSIDRISVLVEEYAADDEVNESLGKIEEKIKETTALIVESKEVGTNSLIPLAKTKRKLVKRKAQILPKNEPVAVEGKEDAGNDLVLPEYQIKNKRQALREVEKCRIYLRKNRTRKKIEYWDLNNSKRNLFELTSYFANTLARTLRFYPEMTLPELKNYDTFICRSFKYIVRDIFGQTAKNFESYQMEPRQCKAKGAAFFLAIIVYAYAIVWNKVRSDLSSISGNEMRKSFKTYVCSIILFRNLLINFYGHKHCKSIIGNELNKLINKKFIKGPEQDERAKLVLNHLLKADILRADIIDQDKMEMLPEESAQILTERKLEPDQVYWVKDKGYIARHADFVYWIPKRRQ